MLCSFVRTKFVKNISEPNAVFCFHKCFTCKSDCSRLSVCPTILSRWINSFDPFNVNSKYCRSVPAEPGKFGFLLMYGASLSRLTRASLFRNLLNSSCPFWSILGFIFLHSLLKSNYICITRLKWKCCLWFYAKSLND